MIHEQIDRLLEQIKACSILRQSENNERKYFEFASGSCFLELIGVSIHAGSLSVLRGSERDIRDFALNLIQRIVTHGTSRNKTPEPVFYISRSSTATELVTRLLSIKSGVETEHLLSGALLKREKTALLDNCAELRRAPLHIEDNQSLWLHEQLQISHRWISEHETELLVVDAPRLPFAEPHRADSTNSAPFVTALKLLDSIAKSTGTPVLLLVDTDSLADEAQMDTAISIQMVASQSLALTTREIRYTPRTYRELMIYELEIGHAKSRKRHYSYSPETGQFDFVSLEAIKAEF